MKKLLFLGMVLMACSCAKDDGSFVVIVHKGDFILNTQQQADNFLFTSIRGRLVVTGQNVTDLSNLSSLKEVGEGVLIRNTALTTLQGLQGLTRFTDANGSIDLLFNDFLVDVSALSNLSTTTAALGLHFNDALQNLEGLGLRENAQKLEISETPISTLSFFSNVRSMGSLALDNVPELASLQGLNNVETLGSLELSGALSFSNFEGLNNLVSINRYTELNALGSLESLLGLENLETINGFLSIAHCNNLTSLDGLTNLQSLGGYLRIRGCNNLSDLGEFSQLSSIGGNVLITELPELSAIDGFHNLQTIGGGLSIFSSNNLVSINGFDSLNTVEGLNFQGLENLTSIKGFASLAETTNIYLSNLPNITSLAWMSNLERIDNDLNIRFMTNLSDLSGLNNITQIKNLDLTALAITSLFGLESLNTLENLYISNCNSLTNLDGTVLASDINPNDRGSLDFWYNSQLRDYCGFTNYVTNVEVYVTTVDNGYNPSMVQIQSTTECSI